MATQNAHTEFKSIQDCPQFLRELIAEDLGEAVEWVTSRIDSCDEAGLELIVESVFRIGELAKAEQERRAAETQSELDLEGGAS